MTVRLCISEAVVAATLGLFAITSHAASPSEKAAKDDYKMTMKTADASYKAAKDGCKTRSGNDKDVCMKEAKASYTKTKADANASRKTRDARADANEDKMKADYKVAREKCDAMSGDSKSRCVDAAKVKYRQ